MPGGYTNLGVDRQQPIWRNWASVEMGNWTEAVVSRGGSLNAAFSYFGPFYQLPLFPRIAENICFLHTSPVMTPPAMSARCGPPLIGTLGQLVFSFPVLLLHCIFYFATGLKITRGARVFLLELAIVKFCALNYQQNENIFKPSLDLIHPLTTSSS